MKPLRTRIREAVQRTGSPHHIVEKDYALSYILAGIVAQPRLAQSLVFKGGTALKKMYFGDYRFSEDLDFSAVEAPRAREMEAAIKDAVAEASRLLSTYGPFQLTWERYTERTPHPGGQDAFVVRVQYPWQQTVHCRIKLEITHDEPMMAEPEDRALIHGYEEPLAATVRTYRIEELIAEKMRTLLQTHQKLLRRGWNRPRARDYYDLWRILGQYGDVLDRGLLPDLLAQKSKHRGVSYAGLDDFFTEQLVREAATHWDANLRAFAANVPEWERVHADLRAMLAAFFPGIT